mgnify:CR=1
MYVFIGIAYPVVAGFKQSMRPTPFNLKFVVAIRVEMLYDMDS